MVSAQQPVVARVELSDSTYSATEGVDSEAEITVVMTPSFGSVVRVGLDYGDDQLTVTFPVGSTSQVVNIPIIDDTMVEDTTEIRLRLSRLSSTPDTVSVDTSYSILVVTDDPDDTASVGFVTEVFEYSESETQSQITIQVTGTVCVDFAVLLETQDNTADSPGDYGAISTIVGFNNNCSDNYHETRKAVSIFIQHDFIAEGRERLKVSLSRTSNLDPRITIDPDEAIVAIVDDDSATVALEKDLYEVREDAGSVVVELPLTGPSGSCPSEEPVSVHLSTIDGTAKSPQDYVSTSIDVEFLLCARLKIVPIQVIDDPAVDSLSTKTFEVKLELAPDTPSFIFLGRDKATVRISDDDMRQVGFVDTEHVLTEGRTQDFEVAFQLDACPTDYDLDLILSTMDPHRAVSPDSQIPSRLSYKICESSRSFTVNTVDVAATSEVVFAVRQAGTPNDRIEEDPWYSKLAILDVGGTTEAFESLDTGNSDPWGLWSDGHTAWVADDVDSEIYAYDMQTKARDSDQDFDALDAGNDSPRGIWSDGTTMWVADHDDGKIYAYQVSDKARDSTKDFDTLSAAGNDNPTGIWSDGTTMWVADDEDDRIHAYELSSKTRDSAKEFTGLNSDNTDPTGIWSDGSTMWVADGADSKIYAYDMATKLRDETEEFNYLPDAGNDDPRGLWSDGNIMWVVDGEDDEIYAYYFPVEPVQPMVRRVSTVSRGTSEPEETDPARPSTIKIDQCISEVVDPDGGEIELGDTIEDRWDYGCQSVTRGGRLAKYYSFTLPITTSLEVALDSHLDDYLVMREGGLSGDLVARDDDSGPSNNSLISGTFPAGQYTIEATTFYADGVEADFTLSVKAVPRVLYDGPVSDVAHRGYAPLGPTLLIKLLPTLPMGTLEITIEDSDGFDEGAGPLGGEQTAGGSAGQVMIALPTTSWVEYGSTEVDVLQSGEWLAHTRADEESMLAGEVGMELSQAMQELVEIVNLTEGAAALVESLTGMTFPEARDGVAQPDEALLDAVFRRSHANCVTQVTLDWLVAASADTTGVRVSMPVSLSDTDHLSVAASFLASEDRPALAQLHDLLATRQDAPGCGPPEAALE